MSNSTFILNILPLYFKGAAANFFGSLSYSALCFKKLTSTSFEGLEEHRYSYRSVFSGIKRLLNVPVSKPDLDCGAHNIIYDAATNTKKERIEFLAYNGVTGDFGFLSSHSLLFFTSTSDKLFFLLWSSPVQLHILLFGLFKKDRSGLNALLKNLLIVRNFLNLNINFQDKKIYFFSIYDTNSAFLSYCLSRKGAYVIQVASEVPLYKWNKIVVTDELALCSEYQKFEIEKFKDTIRLKKVSWFSPEMYYKIAAKYAAPQPKNNKIGFYSTGGWVRKRLGHIDQGTNIEETESRILFDVSEILKDKNDTQLIIYPHPREWVYYKDSPNGLQEHYRKIVSCDFTLHPPGIAANELFDDVYLAVCYMTTLIFERAHANRKSVIAYFKEKNFPLVNSYQSMEITLDKTGLKEIIDRSYN